MYAARLRSRRQPRTVSHKASVFFARTYFANNQALTPSTRSSNPSIAATTCEGGTCCMGNQKQYTAILTNRTNCSGAKRKNCGGPFPTPNANREPYTRRFRKYQGPAQTAATQSIATSAYSRPGSRLPKNSHTKTPAATGANRNSDALVSMPMPSRSPKYAPALSGDRVREASDELHMRTSSSVISRAISQLMESLEAAEQK